MTVSLENSRIYTNKTLFITFPLSQSLIFMPSFPQPPIPPLPPRQFFGFVIISVW